MDIYQTVTDLIIAGISAISASAAICGLLLFSRFPKNRVSAFLLLVLGSLSCTYLFYGTIIEPNQMVVTTQTIDLDDYDDPSDKPVTLILISDLHIGRYNNTPRLKHAVSKIQRIKNPTAVLILGDMVNGSSKHLDELDLLEQVAKAIPTYYILGNHDYTRHDPSLKARTIVPDLERKLEALGIESLNNTSITIRNGIIIGGISDIWSSDYDMSYMQDIREEDAFIFLTHNPDGLLKAQKILTDPHIIDFTLSGHTHGGEIRLPIIGHLWPIPVDLPQSYDRGLFSYNGFKLFITSGIGNVGSRIRTFNPPEIAVLTIR